MPARLRADARVQNGFEFPARLVVGENELAHRGAVEPAFCVEHALAEQFPYLGERRLARFDDLPGDEVGVDHGNAEFREHLADCRLAAGDTAGQADPQGPRVVAVGHLQQRIEVRRLDPVAPEHRDPARGREVRAERNGYAALMAAKRH